jgi:hypothetical protein
VEEAGVKGCDGGEEGGYTMVDAVVVEGEGEGEEEVPKWYREYLQSLCACLALEPRTVAGLV